MATAVGWPAITILLFVAWWAATVRVAVRWLTEIVRRFEVVGAGGSVVIAAKWSHESSGRPAWREVAETETETEAVAGTSGKHC